MRDEFEEAMNQANEQTVDYSAASNEHSNFLRSLLAPTTQPGEIGRLGRYGILGVLGAGGMGIVLRAMDPELGRTVAIKLMPPEVAQKAGARQRFLREAKAIAAVEHPRVVVIHHVDEWNGIPFLVMPLMAGRSLGARIQQRPPIALLEGVRFIREAAEGLAAAHAAGLTHRDVKPDNIWLEETADGTHVRLLDFGVARGGESEPLTQAGAVVGSPSYMAPEQAAGQTVDSRADLFSLGCVLYLVVTGKKAFHSSNVLSALHALANQSPKAPRQLVPTTPLQLSELTMQLLEKSPDKRPATANEVVAVLRRIEKEIEVGQVSDRPEAKWSVQARSRRLVVLGVIASLVMLGLAAVIGRAVTNGLGSGRTPQTNSTNASTSDAEAPLRITTIDVSHFSKTPTGDVPRGLLGRDAFAPELGDRVQISAKLSKPGYAYIIAFRPVGGADLCFPADESELPPLTDAPRYPLTNGLKAYGLQEGTGLWVFAIVASEKPLPAFRDWKERHFKNTFLWTPVSNAPPGVIWRDDGETMVDSLTATGVAHLMRGKDEELDGPAATIRRLTDSLRVTGSTETSAAIGFGVKARK